MIYGIPSCCHCPRHINGRHCLYLRCENQKDAVQHRIDMAKNTIHEKCRPRVKIRESIALARKVMLIARRIAQGMFNPVKNPDKNSWTAANPHQAMVVKCQAKRRICFVKVSLSNNFGRLFRRNSRMIIYFSPSQECAMAMMMVNIDDIKSKFFILADPFKNWH